MLKFPVTSTTRPVGPVVHYNKRWDIAAANHIAHGNADMADEIVCLSLDSNRNVDDSLDVLVVGQVMTDLDASGGRDFSGDDDTQLPKASM